MPDNHNYTKTQLIPIIIIVIAVLIGYYKLFLGYDIWLYWDQLINSSWSYGNSLGNGWRPDKGFGSSFFYADSGASHPWSLQVFWNKLVSRDVAYSSVVVFNSLLSAVAMFFLLRRVTPKLNPLICSLLAPLIVFSISMDSVHYNKHNSIILIIVPLMLILLYDYYKSPKLIHFFFVSLLFWYHLFFGMYLTWSVLPSMGLVFTILYCIYNKESWKIFIPKYVLLLVVGTFIAILLGGWEFYSILLEENLVESVRTKSWFTKTSIDSWSELTALPSIKSLYIYLMSVFQFYSIPTTIKLPGVVWRPFYYGWNVVPFAPLVMIYFLFRKSSSFWEFSIKWLILIYYISGLLFQIPALSLIKTVVNNICIQKFGFGVMPLFNWYFTSWFLFVQPMQLALIAVFLNDIVKNRYELKNLWGKRVQLAVAVVLFIFFCGWALFSLFALVMPDLLPNVSAYIVDKIGPNHYQSYPNYFLTNAVWLNVKILQSSMHWYSLVFYLLAALFIFSFIKRDKLFPLAGKKPTIVASLLLCSGIFYGWTVYPLNNKPLIWEEVKSDLPEFKPFDRFLYVSGESPRHRKERFFDVKGFEKFKDRVKAAGGPGVLGSSFRSLFNGGLHESPGLRLHGHLSFYEKDVSEFINQIFSEVDYQRSPLREKYLYGSGPAISSELLDLGAVSYYYSDNELINPPDNLELIFKKDSMPDGLGGLYIYNNISAWPYFYLADTIEVKEEGKHLKNVNIGSAYVSENNYFDLQENTNKSWIKLIEFSYGRMVFDYYGDKENFLVVADAWHPFWKAKIDDEFLPVIKANEIFKGVKLPSGQGTVNIYFDTSPYFPGVYVSIVAWGLFVTGLILTLKYKWGFTMFKKTTERLGESN